MKELVYTGIFVGLGILLIVLLFVTQRKRSHPMPPPMLQPKRHRMFPVSTIQS